MNKPLALETEHLSPYGPVRGSRGELVYRDSARHMNDGYGNGASQFTGAKRGNPDGGNLTGDPEGYVKEGSGKGQILHRGPVGEHRLGGEGPR